MEIKVFKKNDNTFDFSYIFDEGINIDIENIDYEVVANLFNKLEDLLKEEKKNISNIVWNPRAMRHEKK